MGGMWIDILRDTVYRHYWIMEEDILTQFLFCILGGVELNILERSYVQSLG